MKTAELDPRDFATLVGGQPTELFTLRSATDQVHITNYGARVVAWYTPDQRGDLRDIVLGFGSIKDYLTANETYHGATIGRYANRIANGSFTLDGQDIDVSRNLGEHMLHGGSDGWHQQVWTVVRSTSSAVTMRFIAPDGENGFPGEITCLLTYSLTGSNLQIDYHATTNKITVLSMTHHSFFNLNGVGSGHVLDHRVRIDADHYTPIDAACLPNGKVDIVYDSPLDFTQYKRIGKDISLPHEQLLNGVGYDHNYVVDNRTVGHIKYMAEGIGDQSGIALSCWSDKPGMQFYTGNHLDGSDVGKVGLPHSVHSAFCFEPQYFPDSPNHKDFPSCRLSPQDTYRSTTVYKCQVAQEPTPTA